MDEKFEEVTSCDCCEKECSFHVDYEPEYFLKIYDPDSDDTKDLVTIRMDGTVEVHEYGAEPKSAKVFWDAIQLYGKTFIQQIQELRNRISELTSENEKLKAKLDMFNAI
jgi:uncharacterized small protein (DUF1192 family)